MIGRRLRIFAQTPNESGDLLTRLARDVFYSLGYDDLRLDVHKSGRELDIQGKHRFENRCLIAECKAQQSKVGGGDVNKFVGVLDAERRAHEDVATHGYFLSLSGFTATAIQQEIDAGGHRVTLLDGEQVVKRLEDCKIVVPFAQAVEAAGKVVGLKKLTVTLDATRMELIGHEIGWIWAIFYKSHGAFSHVCLVHADGKVLISPSAAHIGDIDSLTVITAPGEAQDFDVVRAVYTKYLANEYGAITLEGMPADQEVGSRSFRLEELYVPLSFERIQETTLVAGMEDVSGEVELVHSPTTEGSDGDGDAGLSADSTDNSHVPAKYVDSDDGPFWTLGGVIKENRRVAILGPPGAGKTTVLKRLAVAYAQPGRISDSDDLLPTADWFPVVIRCRHLGSAVAQPITTIIRDLIVRAEHPEMVSQFAEVVGERLRSGEILLLVDGLDEISSISDRATFVAQLRTFVATYPQVRLIVASREVGFREVAGSMQSICSRFRVRELSDIGVQTLVRYWHREVFNDGENAKREADELSDAILGADRVRRLARNPLLLTTLLLVKRWVGQLPRRRSVLYQKAIEVLLMTWNVEGHAPIDLEEAVPQLAYAAYVMMLNGKTSIASPELAELFQEARTEMPDLLGYAQTSVHDFLRRVEERSSLLVLSGHELIDGELHALYEFKHLTFQEYLAALAISNAWLRVEQRDREPADLLAGAFTDLRWREVVALTTVLSGRRARPIIERLISECRQLAAELKWCVPVTLKYHLKLTSLHANLVSCLVDEVPMSPDLAAEALDVIIRASGPGTLEDAIELIVDTRYETMLLDIIQTGLARADENMKEYGSALSLYREAKASELDREELLASLEALHNSEELSHQLEALALLMHHGYYNRTGPRQLRRRRRFAPNVVDDPRFIAIAEKEFEGYASGNSTHDAIRFMRTWSIVWNAKALSSLKVSLVHAVQQQLFRHARDAMTRTERVFAAWALWSTRRAGQWKVVPDRDGLLESVREMWESTGYHSSHFKRAALTAGYYLRGPWSREALANMAFELNRTERGSWHEEFSKALVWDLRMPVSPHHGEFVADDGSVGRGP